MNNLKRAVHNILNQHELDLILNAVEVAALEHLRAGNVELAREYAKLAHKLKG